MNIWSIMAQNLKSNNDGHTDEKPLLFDFKTETPSRPISHSSVNERNIWKQNFEHNLKSYFDKIPNQDKEVIENQFKRFYYKESYWDIYNKIILSTQGYEFYRNIVKLLCDDYFWGERHCSTTSWQSYLYFPLTYTENPIYSSEYLWKTLFVLSMVSEYSAEGETMSNNTYNSLSNLCKKFIDKVIREKFFLNSKLTIPHEVRDIMSELTQISYYSGGYENLNLKLMNLLLEKLRFYDENYISRFLHTSNLQTDDQGYIMSVDGYPFSEIISCLPYGLNIAFCSYIRYILYSIFTQIPTLEQLEILEELGLQEQFESIMRSIWKLYEEKTVKKLANKFKYNVKTMDEKYKELYDLAYYEVYDRGRYYEGIFRSFYTEKTLKNTTYESAFKTKKLSIENQLSEFETIEKSIDELRKSRPFTSINISIPHSLIRDSDLQKLLEEKTYSIDNDSNSDRYHLTLTFKSDRELSQKLCSHLIKNTYRQKDELSKMHSIVKKMQQEIDDLFRLENCGIVQLPILIVQNLN
jgi:hypothetical protein